MTTRLEEAHIDRKETLQQLLELYSYDFTRRVDADVDENGKFNYPLDQLGYFRDPNRKAFLIRHNNFLSGFVLIKIENNTTYTINEFFVLFKYRSQGVGRTAATQLFDEHKGQWLINQADTNSPAHKFWRDVVEEYTAGKYEELQENGRTILKFNS